MVQERGEQPATSLRGHSEPSGCHPPSGAWGCESCSVSSPQAVPRPCRPATPRPMLGRADKTVLGARSSRDWWINLGTALPCPASPGRPPSSAGGTTAALGAWSVPPSPADPGTPACSRLGIGPLSRGGAVTGAGEKGQVVPPTSTCQSQVVPRATTPAGLSSHAALHSCPDHHLHVTEWVKRPTQGRPSGCEQSGALEPACLSPGYGKARPLPLTFD